MGLQEENRKTLINLRLNNAKTTLDEDIDVLPHLEPTKKFIATIEKLILEKEIESSK